MDQGITASAAGKWKNSALQTDATIFALSSNSISFFYAVDKAINMGERESQSQSQRKIPNWYLTQWNWNPPSPSPILHPPHHKLFRGQPPQSDILYLTFSWVGPRNRYPALYMCVYSRDILPVPHLVTIGPLSPSFSLYVRVTVTPKIEMGVTILTK